MYVNTGKAAYEVMIDAQSGAELYRSNVARSLTATQAQNALIFPESPATGRSLAPYYGDPNASPNGWSNWGTMGNNVQGLSYAAGAALQPPFTDAWRNNGMNVFDLSGKKLRFTPNDAAASGYSVTVSDAAVLGPNGSDMKPLFGNLDDGSSPALSCSPGISINILGRNYTNVILNINGSVSFGAGSSALTPSKVDFGTYVPRIAALWTDLYAGDSTAGLWGGCYVEGAGSTMVFTWTNVPKLGYSAGNTFSITIHGIGTGLDNVVDISYNQIPATDPIIVGIGGNTGTAYDPATSGNVNYVDLTNGTAPGTGGIAQTFPDPDLNMSILNFSYHLNWMHDFVWGLGFTEAAGNYQLNNFGRGGAGGDPIQAEAQYRLGVYNNAFMSTPSFDGSSPFTAFGLWDDGRGCRRDSGLDAGVIRHEFTHSVTSRLIQGMFATQSGALGEGWSDGFAAFTLNQPVMGAYLVCNTAGIRSVVYNSSPLTYDNFGRYGPLGVFVGSGVVSPGIGQIYLPEVHADGEIWASLLWDIHATFGEPAAAKLVYQGLLYTAAQPSMVDAKDGILIADIVLTGGARTNTLQALFAARGLGVSASSTGNLGFTGTGANPVVFGAYDTGATKYGASLAPLYSTNFPGSGLPAGWTVSGDGGNGAAALWHWSAMRGVGSAYYGLESTGTYDTGYRNYGALDSAAIALPSTVPNGSAIVLTWDQYRSTQNGAYAGAFDGGWVRVIDTATGNRTQVAAVPDTLVSNYFTAFQTYKVNLNRFAGKTIKVEFFMDTFDTLLNAYPGWFVTNFAVGMAFEKAAMISPLPGSQFGGSSVTFTWSPGTSNVSQYWLYVSPTPGGQDIYSASQGLNTSVTVTGIPRNNQPVFVTVWSNTLGVWYSNQYQYTEAANGSAQITSPTNGSTLSASTTFIWNNIGASQYWLFVGSTQGGQDVYSADQGTSTRVTVSLPIDGRTLYVRLWSWSGTAWTYQSDMIYSALKGAPAQMLTPIPMSMLPVSPVTFTWTPGTGVSYYYIHIGTTGPGSFNVYNSPVYSQILTVPSLPTGTGVTIYFRLWSSINGVFSFNDYKYTAHP